MRLLNEDGRRMSNIEEYYYLSAAEYELKIHKEIECPNWLKLEYPEIFRKQRESK